MVLIYEIANNNDMIDMFVYLTESVVEKHVMEQQELYFKKLFNSFETANGRWKFMKQTRRIQTRPQYIIP